MPFKCVTCNTVVQSEEVQECLCANPRFKPCAMIHFLDSRAPGPVYSNRIKKSSLSEKGGGRQVVVETQLRLGCNHRQGTEQCTMLTTLVTCPHCLEYISTVIPPKVAESKDHKLDLDKVDITDEELKLINTEPPKHSVDTINHKGNSANTINHKGNSANTIKAEDGKDLELLTLDDISEQLKES